MKIIDEYLSYLNKNTIDTYLTFLDEFDYDKWHQKKLEELEKDKQEKLNTNDKEKELENLKKKKKFNFKNPLVVQAAGIADDIPPILMTVLKNRNLAKVAAGAAESL